MKQLEKNSETLLLWVKIRGKR